MRRAYSDAAAFYAESLPEGVLDFDLVTPHRDTYKTRLDPMGAMFHSAARPWCDAHDTSTVKNVLGEMAEVVEQSPERFRVRVRFDMADQSAADAYRKHKEGFLKGCSVGFDPIEGATHIEEPEAGERCARCNGRGAMGGDDCISCFGTGNADAVLVYDKYYVLEGSSCAAPSNPMALCVRAIEDARAARKPSKQTEKSAESRPDNHPDHVRNAASSNFAFTSGVFPMKPENRAHHRYMIGDHMRMAEDHLGAMAATDHPEERKFHRDASMGCMRTAMHLARMVADSMAEGHEDAPEDAQMIGAMMRACPVKDDAEIGAEWAAAQRATIPFGTSTWADIGKKLAKDPIELRTAFASMAAVNAAHKKMLSEQRSAAKATEESDRQKLVLELAASEVGLEPALEAQMLGFDAVGYERGSAKNARSAEGAWPLEQIRTYKLQVQGAVAQVTRTAPLKTVTPSGEVRAAQETTLQQGNVDRGAQVAGPLGAFIDELAKRTGADPAKVRAAAANGSAPNRAFLENSMTARISEVHAKRSA